MASAQELSSRFEAMTQKWEAVARNLGMGTAHQRAFGHLEFQQEVTGDMILITCGMRDLARLLRDHT